MPSSKDEIIDYMLTQGGMAKRDPDFPNAPEGWTKATAQSVAAAAGLTLTDEHWEVVRVLQGAFKEDPDPKISMLQDALTARFAGAGGMKHLFQMLPCGPIAQGCRLAGLEPPAGATDSGFGSVR